MRTVTYQDICEAHERIGPYVHRTPILKSRIINDLAGGEIYFKCENFQRGGSFKVRGAMNAIHCMSHAEVARGVVTHSSGNHAAAVAIGCASIGTRAFTVMPTSAPQCKKNAVRDYGATVIECAATMAARKETADGVLRDTGGTFLHPYDDDRVIAGQGTAAREMIEDSPQLDIIMCPVGGGGLLAGTAITSKSLAPSVVVLAGEPLGADDAKRSFESGEIVTEHRGNTIADGLLTTLGNRNFAIMMELVDDVLTARDDSIVLAMRLIWQHMKVIIEPSSAVPLACLLEHKVALHGRKVGIILTGGNLDLDSLPWSSTETGP